MPTCCRADSISIDPFKNDHHLKPKYMVLKKVLTQVGFYVKTSVGGKLRKKQFWPDSITISLDADDENLKFLKFLLDALTAL